MRPLLGLLLILLAVSSASAFKIGSHIATANQLISELEATPAQNPYPLKFVVDGKEFVISVTQQEAMAAILKWKPFFRAGIIGPDGFPDAITGQMLEHGNRTDVLQSSNVFTTGGVLPADNPKTDVSTPFEARTKPSQFRAIDHAMAMLQYAKEGYAAISPNEREQIIAFVMGYFGHCIGDGFMHQFVNKKTFGAWNYVEGGNQFGPLSEEIRHVVVEGWVDEQIPGRLQNADKSEKGEFDLYAVATPVKFLDSWFSMRAPNAPIIGDKNQSWETFKVYYSNVDQFRGGPIYNYFNSQIDAANSILNWYGLREYVNLAAQFHPGETADEINHWYETATLQTTKIQKFILGDKVSAMTNGYLNCDIDLLNVNFSIYRTFRYLTEFKKRIDQHREMATLARMNWLKLSECTGANFARLSGTDWNAATPTKNRDVCRDLADMADKGIWGDAGGAGLFKGSIDYKDTQDKRSIWLRELVATFRDDGKDGLFSNSGNFQENQRHRSFVGNVSRLRTYLLGPAFTMSQLDNIILPKEIELQWNSLCNIVGDVKNGIDGPKRRCVNLKLLPASIIATEAMCLADQAKCAGLAGKKAEGCYRKNCTVSKKVCDNALVGCKFGHCNDEGYCSAFGVPTLETCVTQVLCEKGIKAGLSYLDVNDKCSNAGLKEMLNCNPINYVNDVSSEFFTCSVNAGIDCIGNNLNTAFLKQGVGDWTMDKTNEMCKTVDRAKAFRDDYDTPAERRDFIYRRGVPLDEIDRALGAWKAVIDEVKEMPPNQQVNFVYLEKDLQVGWWQDKILKGATDWNAVLAASGKPVTSVDRQAAARIIQMATNAKNGAKVVWKDIDALTLNSSNNGIRNTLENNVPAVTSEGDITKAALHSFFAGLPDGPTATALRTDFGRDITKEFVPFYNTVQGLKLLQLEKQGDIEGVFTKQGVSLSRLPWKATTKYSRICQNPNVVNLYCDVIESLDDPDCLDCKNGDKNLKYDDPATGGWGIWWGRSVTPYVGVNPITGAINYNLTPFPLSSSDDAFNKIYRNVFKLKNRPNVYPWINILLN